MNRFPDEALTLASQLIRQFEGCRTTAYRDLAGTWTIGWGDTRDVRPGLSITQEEADQRLADQIAEKAQGMNGLLQVGLTANQAGALLDFAYNVGIGAFGGSKLLRLLNAGSLDSVPTQLMRWTKSNGIVIQGLVNRRQAECDLWSRDAA